jgi:hypothetical protein
MALPCRWRSRPQHHKRTHAPRVAIRLLMPQLFDSVPLFPVFSFEAREHFEGHFEESVPVFASANASQGNLDRL